jgi:serine/threonine protein kinase
VAQPVQHKLFICYSHTDQRYREHFSKFLEPQRLQTQMAIFSDEKIAPGEEWQKRITEELASATAALILVSQDFMISPLIQQVELREILVGQVRRGLRLFLVPVRATNYQGTYLERFQWARPPDKPLALLSDAQQEQAMVDVCVSIAAQLNEKADDRTIEQTIECLKSIPKLDLPPNYELGEPVGVGEFARCYRAHDRLMERRVIVKVLTNELTQDSPAYDKYVSSANLLTHPTILGVLFSQANKLPHFLVTLAVEGPTLKERLAATREYRPLGYQEAVERTIEIADALAYAHRRGCVHGRIRPCEIRFDQWRNNAVVLSGFRTIRSQQTAATGSSDERMTLEEFQYASPEQRERRIVDKKTDQYLLGLVAYEMIAGAPPAAIASWAAMLDPAVAEALLNPRPLKEAGVGCDERASDVIMKMLSVDPAARWESLEVVKRELQNALAARSCVDVAKASYRRCAQSSDFYRTVYDNLFVAMPAIKGMFRDPSLERQYQVLRDALWLLLTFPETSEQGEPTILSGIARTHSQIPCDFDKFRDAVLDAVARHDSAEPATVDAWRDAMKPGFEYLKSKIARVTVAGV